MSVVRQTAARRPRVYTIWALWLTALLVAAVAVGSAQTVPTVDADPTMVKGPATAPVTIVEFSDYQ